MADDRRVNIRKAIDEHAKFSDVGKLAASGVRNVRVLDEAGLQRMIEQAVDEVVQSSNAEERSRILADSRKQLTKLMNERDQVASRANLAEAGHAELIAQIEKLQNEVKLHREVAGQEIAGQKKTEEISAENVWLRENNDKLVEELDQAKSEIKALQEEIARLKARIAELEGEAADTREAGTTAVAAVRLELDRTRQHTANLEQALAEARARADEVEEESADVQGSAQSKLLEAQQELLALREQSEKAGLAAQQEIERLRKDLERAATAEVLDDQPEYVPTLVLPSEPTPAPPPKVTRPGKGLDVGTVNLVSAETNENNDVEIRQQRNVFLDVEITPYTKAMLTKLEVPYFIQNKRMYILGESAFKLANVLNRRSRRPMKDGLISPKEQDALPVMKLLIGSILGEPRIQDEVCFYSVPGDPVDSDLSVAYHRDLFDAVLKALGYKPSHILEGHAVTFSELDQEDFTGIGVSCGGGMFNVCVVYKSLPALTFSTARSGDWVDMNVAQALNIKPEKAAQIKEQGVDLMAPKSREADAVAIYYRNLLTYNLNSIAERFRSAENMPSFKEPVSLVFSGGTAMAGGFIELAREVFSKLDFPIPVKELRLAKDPLNATAKGALVAAQLEMANRPA